MFEREGGRGREQGSYKELGRERGGRGGGRELGREGGGGGGGEGAREGGGGRELGREGGYILLIIIIITVRAGWKVQTCQPLNQCEIMYSELNAQRAMLGSVLVITNKGRVL